MKKLLIAMILVLSFTACEDMSLYIQGKNCKGFRITSIKESESGDLYIYEMKGTSNILKVYIPKKYKFDIGDYIEFQKVKLKEDNNVSEKNR